MTTTMIPARPRIRTPYIAPDGGCCSVEWVFASGRVVELATQFNTLPPDEQAAFGSPSADQVRTGIALFVRFVAYCQSNGVEVENQGTCIDYTRPANPDVIGRIVYNDDNPITQIAWKSN